MYKCEKSVCISVKIVYVYVCKFVCICVNNVCMCVNNLYVCVWMFVCVYFL